jgi:hypothetical protein
MALTNAVKNRLITRFQGQLARGRQMYDTVVRNGMRRNVGADPTNLMNHDKRDAAQFIFFEVAAQFEDFACEAFKMEVRHRLEVSPSRAEYIMGSADRGLEGVMGWGAPKQIRERAMHLFGQNGFFARLIDHLGQADYDRLIQAHIVRNRIAHSGGKARKTFVGILGQLQVPEPQRQGLSVGRLLTEYPPGAGVNDRWFYRFLVSYENCLNAFNAQLVIQ